MSYRPRSKFLMIGIFVVVLIFLYPVTSVLAHNFYNNRYSIFYTLVKRLEVEEKLASKNLSDSKTLALNHSENAADLFKQIVSLNSQESNNSNIVSRYNNIFAGLNTTTKALVVANLADQSLKQYGMAEGLDSSQASGLLNMSMSMNTQMIMAPTMNTTGDLPGKNSDMMNTNQANYETSTMLANTLKMIFTNNLQNASLQKSTGLMQIPTSIKLESVKNLGNGINNLISALNEKRSLAEVYSIVHGQIHPHLFLAYDLKLKGE